MPSDVKWSEDALFDFQEILRYLNENWGSNSVLKFQAKVEKEISIISEMPGIFPFINKLKKILRCVIVKQVSLYYMELEVKKEIYIIRLLNNKQSPETIQDELNKF
jgi:plasmid stabilization system protein ParE